MKKKSDKSGGALTLLTLWCLFLAILLSENTLYRAVRVVVAPALYTGTFLAIYDGMAHY